VQFFKVRGQDALAGLSNGRDYSYPAKHVNVNRFRPFCVTAPKELFFAKLPEIAAQLQTFAHWQMFRF